MTSPNALAALSFVTRREIGQAGARYTPGVHPGAPNIEIEELLTAFGHLACGPELRVWAAQAIKDLEAPLGGAKAAFQDPGAMEAGVKSVTELLAQVAAKARAGDLTIRDEVLAALESVSTLTTAEAARLEEEERQAAEHARQNTPAGSAQDIAVANQTNAIRTHLHAVRQLERQLNVLREHFAGPPGFLLVNRLCLLGGQWGTGKTHFLCDLAKHRIDEERPALLLLAKSFQSRAVGSAIARSMALGSLQDLLDRLNELGAQAEERALLLIDGINEGPRTAWRATIEQLTALLTTRPNVALVVSCRSPLENHAVPEQVLSRMVRLVHRGFNEQEFDAQAEFFGYYGVPLPEVPLLDEEFSRPLTLKLICEAFRGLGTKKLKDGFYGVASGQKGMTFVLESFVKDRAKDIEARYGLPRFACWEVLKGRGNIPIPRDAGFAGHMAATLREYVSWRAAYRIVRAHFPSLNARQRRQFLEDMRVSGLLDEDSIWRSTPRGPKSISVLRLPYQRFSDHLIARHLLEKHLDKTSHDTVVASFRSGRPLGRVFGRRRYSQDYARLGWAEALIVEFPEAVKRLIATEEREVFFFLPKRSKRFSTYYKPFVQGLFWRAPTSFPRATDRITGALLEQANEHAWRETVDALVALAIKPRHPYSARRLYGYLAKFSMAERDKRWTEYLRMRYESPSVVRLLTWIARLPNMTVSAEVAEELIVVLSLVLTTLARRDRDIATRALVELGEKHSKLLFDHAVRALDFNDPYVCERMLAACYGVAMSLASQPKSTSFHKVLAKLARRLYAGMFAVGAPHATHHTLRRDYALGVIRLALSVEPSLLNKSEVANLEAPFSQIPDPFHAPTEINEEVIANAERAIHMDFGNYTIGHLIPNRRNYDHENLEYKRVRRQIEGRIWDLGYRKADFEAIDRQIGEMSFHAEQRNAPKTDRYGKKYSWIAYFEMYGLREAQGLLERRRIIERTSDCDIDPSFPKPPPDWDPPLPQLFNAATGNPDDWVRGGFTPDFSSILEVGEINGIKGPWVLVQGFVQRQDQPTDREIFTFLRGFFLKRNDVDAFRDAFLGIEYPGNFNLPDGDHDTYAFAGEAGRSPRFAPGLIRRDGRYRRHIEEAFGRTEFLNEESASSRGPVTLRFPKALLEKMPDDPSTGATVTVEITLPPLRKTRRIPGVRVELPYRRYRWESYHSSENSYSGFSMPAASIIDELSLRTSDRETDFRDSAGRFGSLYRELERDEWGRDSHNLLYLRKDLLLRYLAKTRQTLVWCNWGERSWADKGPWHSQLPEGKAEILRAHQHIHRRFHRFR